MALAPVLIVMEATGGFELTAAITLAKAMGQLAKTDARDAGMLAAEKNRLGFGRGPVKRDIQQHFAGSRSG